MNPENTINRDKRQDHHNAWTGLKKSYGQRELRTWSESLWSENLTAEKDYNWR
jgi:hypothetical protein